MQTHNASGPRQRQLRVGEWEVYPNACTLEKDSVRQKITPRSMDVLTYLSQRPGEVVSLGELLENVWRSRIVNDQAVHKAVAELRSVLKDNAQSPNYIRTFPKRGYALIAPVAYPRRSTADNSSPRFRFAGLLSALGIYKSAVTVAGGLIIASLAGWMSWQSWFPEQPADDDEAEIVRLAVPPVVSSGLSNDKEILADGIREALINGLSLLSDLQVFSGPPSYPQDSEHQGSVSHILYVSMVSADRRLRVIVQLIRTTDGLHLYSDQFDLPMTDIFSIQDTIVFNVVSSLRVLLDEEERSQMLNLGTRDALAYEYFLHGESYNNQFNPEDWRKAIKYYQKAIEQDPDFVNAYYGVATAANNLAIYSNMETAHELYKLVLSTHRELSRIAPRGDVLDSVHAIKLRMNGNSHIQYETHLREQILSGSPPDYAITHYARLLISARLYDEAERFLTRASEIDLFEMSPDEVRSYRNAIKPIPELIQARKVQLQQRPYHIAFLGEVATNLAFLNDFRQAKIYQDLLVTVDTGGVFSHYSEIVIDFLQGKIKSDSEALNEVIRDNPDYYYNNGVLYFMLGDIERGSAYWRQLKPVQMRWLFNMIHRSELYFPDYVTESPRYHTLLDDLGLGKGWQRRLMESVMAMEKVTGVGLSEKARQAYYNDRFMSRNDHWSREDWVSFEQYRSQLQPLASTPPETTLLEPGQ